jgi:hypothetical protein
LPAPSALAAEDVAEEVAGADRRRTAAVVEIGDVARAAGDVLAGVGKLRRDQAALIRRGHVIQLAGDDQYRPLAGLPGRYGSYNDDGRGAVRQNWYSVVEKELRRRG